MQVQVADLAAAAVLKALSRPSQRLQEFQGGGVFSRG
jgi:hypothetical protein